jgi:hypothetical protein
LVCEQANDIRQLKEEAKEIQQLKDQAKVTMSHGSWSARHCTTADAPSQRDCQDRR